MKRVQLFDQSGIKLLSDRVEIDVRGNAYQSFPRFITWNDKFFGLVMENKYFQVFPQVVTSWAEQSQKLNFT